MKLKNLLYLTGIIAIGPMMQSCDDDNDNYYFNQSTALVTVCPQGEDNVLFQLTDDISLHPVNVNKPPYGKKEVRALISYRPLSDDLTAKIQDINLFWIDSIRTKLPVQFNADDITKYGNDPLEIVKDWVTVAEDGYLTLRIRTRWAHPSKPHTLTLTYGNNPSDPMEFVLYQNADGDTNGEMADALIAFNLNQLLADTPKPAKITLKWKSYNGEKSTDFTFNANRGNLPTIDGDAPATNSASIL